MFTIRLYSFASWSNLRVLARASTFPGWVYKVTFSPLTRTQPTRNRLMTSDLRAPLVTSPSRRVTSCWCKVRTEKSRKDKTNSGYFPHSWFGPTHLNQTGKNPDCVEDRSDVRTEILSGFFYSSFSLIWHVLGLWTTSKDCHCFIITVQWLVGVTVCCTCSCLGL